LLVSEPFRTLRSQGYHIVGRHSAVKTCLWVKNSLTKGKVCYKQKFYRIKSHRCLQMSPAVAYCSNRCLYCWRLMPGERGLEWDGERMPEEDDPREMVEESLKVHRKALNGFKGNPLVPREKWEEAVRPRHVAISLSGEPTNYSRLDGLIEEFGRRRMTTFLVTNGTNPEGLKRIREPTQLYVSLSAPSEEAYMHVGFSTGRLGFESMPSHREILGFAKELAERTGYEVVDEVSISRVALLSRRGKPKKVN